MEHGPTSTISRASRLARMRVISRRLLKIVAIAASDVGRSSSRNTGGRTTLVHLMRRSSVGCDIDRFLTVALARYSHRRLHRIRSKGKALLNLPARPRMHAPAPLFTPFNANSAPLPLQLQPAGDSVPEATDTSRTACRRRAGYTAG